MSLASDISFVFSTLTVIANIITVLLLISLIFKKSELGKNIISFVGKRAVLGAFIVSLIATIGSLMYSDIVGFEPCKFCWFQRIFMYPQVLILAIALWKRDAGVVLYSFVLSFVGAVIAFYHYLVQLGIFETTPCSVTGVSCNKIFIFSYGYITIPMMAFSAFVLIIVFGIVKFSHYRL